MSRQSRFRAFNVCRKTAVCAPLEELTVNVMFAVEVVVSIFFFFFFPKVPVTVTLTGPVVAVETR